MAWIVKQEGINKETKTRTTVRDKIVYKQPNSSATVCINYRPEPDSGRKDTTATNALNSEPQFYF